MSQTTILSVQVLSYPYYGSTIESKKILSERICSSTIRIRKYIIKKLKWVVFSGEVIICLNTDLSAYKAIGVTIFPTAPAIIIIRPDGSDSLKKIIIAQAISNSSEKFSEQEINQFYQLAIKYKNSYISQKQLIAELRGGDLQGTLRDWVAKAGIVMSIIILLNNVEPGKSFQMISYKDLVNGKKNKKEKDCKLIGWTANAGSETEENESSFYPYDTNNVMKRLKILSKKTKFNITIGREMYKVNNRDRLSPDALKYVVAESLYSTIRETTTDVEAVALNLGFKVANVQRLKNHLFYNIHELDRYGPGQTELKRFDATLEQALAWKRQETGTEISEDDTWIKHEYAELAYEKINKSGYFEVHNYAQKRYDSEPWPDNLG